MLPLSPNEYGLKAGQAIPGWQGTDGTITGGGGNIPVTTTGGGGFPSTVGTNPLTSINGTQLPGNMTVQQNTDIINLMRKIQSGYGGALSPSEMAILQTNPAALQVWQDHGGGQTVQQPAPPAPPPPAPVPPQQPLPPQEPAQSTQTGNWWPGIPNLAGGGIVDRPTLAVVGEQGPEMITPLIDQ